METVDPTIYEYRQPRFIGSRLVRCSLEEHELTVDVEGKRPVRVRYQDITAVLLLSRSHGRNEAMLYVRDFRCRVIGRRQVVEITNRSDGGVGHRYLYENRAFNGFVRELHRRLLPFQERVRFRSGSALYFRIVVVGGALAAIVCPFRFAPHGLGLTRDILAYFVAMAGVVAAARRLRPRSYPPTNVPDELLPPEKDHRGIIA